ncbi:phage head closure protein [Paenibacillus thermotolerans]|uniref:phage head closure protein n=1 Tax=Paenibacillus thermotolerans TaxID=3027807 RepID=UPI0023674DB0|nr:MULTISPECIES: phage head closure protein [unclassified Paenibacillus]
MRFSEVVHLVELTYAESAAGANIVEGIPRQVFAERKSVRQTEFYQALGNALRPEVTFVIWAAEYRGEPRLLHNGIPYEVIRTFETSGRRMELVCSALDDVLTNLSRLRDTVEIWHNTFVTNSMKERSPAPALLYMLPAQIEYNGGGTSEVDEVFETTSNVVVTIVYREGITADMFIKINGQRWNIEIIENPFNRNATLRITAKRVIP